MMLALGLTLAVALLTWDTAPLRAQEPAELPPGVTAADTAASHDAPHEFSMEALVALERHPAVGHLERDPLVGDLVVPA
jgi:hypothetical protein